jgi:hypothetical protein
MKNILALFSSFGLLGGCSVMSVGAEGRAKSEEAALHKLLDGQQSYSFVVQTMSNRPGYSCSDQPTQFLADRRTLEKFIPPKQGRAIVCSKSFDWNTPPISCSWRILFNADAIENDSVESISIKSYQACI